MYVHGNERTCPPVQQYGSFMCSYLLLNNIEGKRIYDCLHNAYFNQITIQAELRLRESLLIPGVNTKAAITYPNTDCMVTPDINGVIDNSIWQKKWILITS